MKIEVISDLHGHYPKLEGGDLLIVAGDLTRSDEPYQYEFLYDILKEKNYKKIIIIAGNHDNCLQNGKVEFIGDSLIEYLCDSATEFQGLKIWGSPWTKTFEGMNSNCKAFTVNTEEELAEKWAMIPDDTDILITHGPPYGVLDKNQKGQSCGSISLLEALNRIKPLYMVFGHIHEQGGRELLHKHIGPNTRCFNVSHVNEYYKPVNPPIRIDLGLYSDRSLPTSPNS